jgi:Fic family protein
MIRSMRGTLLERRWTYDPSLNAPQRYRRACAYEAFIPYPLEGIEVQMDGELAALISEAEGRITALNERATPALAPLGRLLLRTESIASSRVEGLQADVRTVARGEVAHDTGRPVGGETSEVIANVDAMEFAIETMTATRRIAPAHLLDTHRLLMARALPERAGRFRTSQGWIGGNPYNPCGAAFVPAPEEHIGALVDDLCAFSSEEIFSPLTQAAIAHAQFETIHPFDDGNGRTGRALLQVLLRRRGLAPAFVPPISVALAAEKDRYIRGLTAFREDRMEELLEIFAVAAGRSARLATTYLERVAALQEDWRTRLRRHEDLRADAAAWGLIDVLPGYPVITVAVAVAAMETHGARRARSAVQVAVTQLEEAGVLRPISASRRNRAWEADGLLDLVTDLEAGITRR